jgi:ATP-dependent helicase/nuclease subunit A
MARAPTDLSPGAQATAEQRKAADTNACVWVGASAGTGKTKVLTDRVLSLLLRGTRPERILCLTFTRAAAAEMANRVRESLGLWAVARDAKLAEAIETLTGAPPEPDHMVRARGLFGAVLDCPGGLKIQTIHAFCESLLRRFPVEAGLQPHFQLMDERTARELLAQAGEEVLARAMDGGGAPEPEEAPDGLSAALPAVSGHLGPEDFHKLMDRLAGDRTRLRLLLARAGGLDGASRAIAGRLGLEGTESEAAVIAAAVADDAFDGPGLRRALAVMEAGSKRDAARAGAMAPFLAAEVSARAPLLADYRKGFLTNEGAPFASFITAGGLKDADDPDGLIEAMAAEADRLVALGARLKSVRNWQTSVAALSLGAALVETYEVHKQFRALLDYDDLILKTRDLLEGSGASQWVLFKLDGGLDHILVDEAQDTSPDQWGVIGALADDFFAGAGAREEVRTVFAVGDAKQSIYSFQRADPDAFEDMRDFFRIRAEQAGQRWADVDLHVSFRSTEAVLGAVDAVFAAAPAREGVGPPGAAILHQAERSGQAGRVELWPLVPTDDPSPADPWAPDLKAETGFDAPDRLARVIAAQIKGWIADGEMLPARGRPVRAGDIMVLVRRRTGFVDALVRALKRLDIPVAGVDRMVVTGELAVMDLVALGRFALLPEDDLNLACVLKGPFLGFDEDALFALAHERTGTLWAALTDHAARDERCTNARDWLGAVLARADRARPFEFFSALLDREDGRERLLARLGREAADPVNEFLELALAYERTAVPSLEGFLAWAGAGAVEIKRDLEQLVRDEVRVMTVHGAKGLQAPIVFLPDTTHAPRAPDLPYWAPSAGAAGIDIPLWAPPRIREFGPDLAALRSQALEDQKEESHRLLYVAMTRAEDRLYVCGWQGRRAIPDDCWYEVVRGGLEAAAATAPIEVDLGAGVPGLVRPGLRLDRPQEAPPKEEGDAAPGPAEPPDLGWADRPPAPEPARTEPLTPSDPGEEPPVASPSAEGGAWFLRGRLIHGLLQHLPEIEPDGRAEAARRVIGRAAHSLDGAAQEEIVAETLALLDDPAFAALFGPGSLAEVSVTGAVDGAVVSGQVDRLVVTEDEVLVVDYKTGRRAPHSVEQVPPAYLRQMALYRALLARAFPGRRVKAGLVFTTVPRLLALPDAALDAAFSTHRPA